MTDLIVIRMLTLLQKANFIYMFGFFQSAIDLVVSPKAARTDNQHAEVKIPLKRRTKNHLISMYFGVLAVGADVAAFRVSRSNKVKKSRWHLKR